MIQIVDRNNLPLDESIRRILEGVLSKIRQSGKIISDALKFTTQRHFQTIYPSSKHYNPNKVKNGNIQNGNNTNGSIDINVAGVTRAYKNLHIKPIHKNYLTIPLHRSAYGKGAGEFSDLFVVNKKSGQKFLARKNGSNGITFMYLLSKSVFQKQDKRLMPTNETFAKNIMARIGVYLNRQNGN